MYRKYFFASLLVFALVFNSIGQLGSSNTASEFVAQKRSATPIEVEKLFSELPKLETSGLQEGMDAATKNFLSGLKGTQLEVAKIVIETVNKTGGKVVAVGSWVSGKNYLDPLSGGTSDHDLRVVFEGSESLSIAKYKQLRREIINQITQKFPNNAQKVLNSVNLYPPEVILEGIDDAEEALQKLKDLGINPNLGDAVTEGLWGKGAKAFRDAYEAKAGRVIWKEGNMIRSGIADLLPGFGETAGIYTIEGSANTANQFAEKISDALKAGDAKTVQKNLKRLRDAIKKGRDLGRFGQPSYLDDLVNTLDQCCKITVIEDGKEIIKTDFEKLAVEINKPEFRQGLAEGLQRAKFEAEVLLRWVAESNPENLKILRELLQVGSGKWTRVKEAFLHYAGRVAEIGGKVRWDLALKGFFAVLTAYQVYDYAKKITQADLEGLLQNALLDATLLVSAKFVIGFVPLILKAIMDDAVDYGYALITSQQDCQDLIAGIYEVKGRESLDVNQRAERSVDQLATEYTEDEKVLAVVALHAHNAATRDGKADPKAEKILYDRCSEEIVNRWRMRRIQLISDAIDILKKVEIDFNSSNLIGTAKPEEFWLLPEQQGTVEVKTTFEGETQRIQQNLAEFEKRIKLLGGKEKLVAVEITHRYRWMPFNLTDEVSSSSAQPIFETEKASRQFKFTSDLIENLRLEYELVIDVKTIADDVLSVVSELDKTLSKSVSFNLKILRPNGTAEIIVPSNVEAEKPITLTVGLDENLKKLKDYKLFWQDLGEASAPKTGNSYSFTLKENESKNVRLMVYAKLNGVDTRVAQDEKTITVGKKDKTPTPTPTPTPETFDSTKLRFGGTMPDIWTGGSNDRGFEVSRQFAKMSGTGDCSADHWAATVQGKVFGEIGPAFVYDEKDIQTEITNFIAYSKAWGRTAEVRDFAIGDFKGKFADSSLNFIGGTGGMFGFTNDSVKAEGRGWIIKGKQVVAIGYLVTGNGCFDNHDQAFLMSQGRAAQAEAKAIVNSLTLIGGTFAKTPYKGPKLDGSDMPKLKLVVSPDLKKLKKGDVVNVQAVIENEENAEKPLQFNWTGDHAGSGASVKFLANKPGKQSLSVNVPSVGSAAVEFEVANLKAEIKLVTPQTKVAVGVPVAFTAQLLSDGSPLTGNYIYRFQPSPEVKFDTNESAKQQTNAIFAKPGREKVWVQILERKGQTLETVAESEQIEIEIVAPELKITFDQDKALVGKAVKAKVEVVPPDLKNIDFRWEIPANAKQTLQSPDAKEVTFIPQNTNPITVKVNARVPVSGEDLGAKEATITAQKYDVRVNVLGAEGPKPQVWKEGVGLVTVENGIAIHQFVGLRAEVSPMPENPRFEWTLNEDSHFAGNSITQQIRVSRSQTGTCEATVIVRDKDGIELGRGSGTFNVSVSQMELDKAKTMGGTTGKLTQAKDIIKKGQLDEAIKLVDEVLKASPKNTEAVTLSKKWKKDRTTITAQLAKVRSLIDQQMFPEASNELIVAKNLHNLYPPVLEIEKELNDKWGKHDSGVNQAVGEVRLANEARNFKKALELAKEVRAKYRLMSGTEQTLKNYEDWATTHEAEKNRQRAILQQGEAKFNAYDYEGAIKDFDVMWGNNHYEYWSIYEPEPKKYGDLRNEAFTRLKRINELMPLVGQVVDNPNFNKTMIQTALKNVDEVLQIQPTNAKAQEYKTTLTERLGRGEKGMQYEQAIKKGNEYSDAQNYGEAIKEYDKAIKSDGKSAEAYRLRGRAKRANGDLKGALKDFDKSIEINPTNSKTFVGRGLVREKLPDIDGALSDYSRAIELDPNYTAAYSNRGGLRIDINDFQGAIADFDKVISLDPKNTSAYINRGVAKTRLENYNEALKDYNKAIELDPKMSLTYNNRGYTKEKLNDLKGALSDYEKAVALDPNSETAQSRLAKLKEKMQGNQVAVKPSPTPLPTPTAKPTPKPTPTNVPVGKEVEIFNNMNIYGVQNKPTALTKFTITKPHVITYIFTYHWNNASGNRTVGFIGIYNEKGERFGPWQAKGTAGQGGVPNANWEISPNIIIPAGTYTIVVSQEETWSQNGQSGGRGMAIVKGYPTNGTTQTPNTKPSNIPTPTPKNTPTTPKQGAIVVAVIQNRSSEPTHIFAEGDTFGPQNKIAPGASKEVSVRMTADGRIKFFAGRNGQIITSKIWTGDPSDMNRYPKVIFDGSQLIITTGLR